MASLEPRIAARETVPLVLQPTKGPRKRTRKPNTRQLHIISESRSRRPSARVDPGRPPLPERY